MAATEVLDVAKLSTFCSLPQSSITTLLEAPTPELVHTLFQNIIVKAGEYEEARSGKLKASVELENAVRGGDAKNRLLKSSIDRGLKEAADLRQKLEDGGKARSQLGQRTASHCLQNKSERH